RPRSRRRRSAPGRTRSRTWIKSYRKPMSIDPKGDDVARLCGESRKLLGALILMLGVGAAAFGQTPNGYDKTWFISEGWSREYPPGFSVTRPGTVVKARKTMDKAAARDVDCKLPYLAVIQPWNRRRAAKSNIKFLSATKIIRLVVKDTFDFEDESSRNPAKIPLRKGDTVEYIRNDAEGSFEVRIAGKQYTADQNLFEHVEDVPQDQFVEDDWALLTCEGGNRAYILLADFRLDSDDAAARTPGISDVGPGQAGYGRARDLTAAEARELEKAK